MSYVSIDYYTLEFGGKLSVEIAQKLLREASDQVDRLTYGRIRCKGFENITEYQQEMVKKAVCHQVEFMSKYGEYLNSPLDGFSIGDVSLSFNKDNRVTGGIVADKKALDYLFQTGLTSRRL